MNPVVSLPQQRIFTDTQQAAVVRKIRCGCLFHRIENLLPDEQFLQEKLIVLSDIQLVAIPDDGIFLNFYRSITRSTT
jgi:hypothetical protein